MTNFMQSIQQLLEDKIDNATVHVSDMTGTSDHLEISVESPIFEGKNLLSQHRIVMDILKDEFKDKLHAVKLKTSAPK